MKKGIHPEYHPIKVVMTDGTEFVTQSTWGESGAKLTLVIDSKNHPAYTGERKVVDSMGRMEKFRLKYGQSAAAAPKQQAASAPAEEPKVKEETGPVEAASPETSAEEEAKVEAPVEDAPAEDAASESEEK